MSIARSINVGRAEVSRPKPANARSRRYLPLLASYAGLCLALGSTDIASAQNGGLPPVTSPADIAKHPGNYLDRPVDWRDGYCFVDKPTYVCIGRDLPFEVVLQHDIPAGAAKSLIDENCGDINGTERNPVTPCAFSFDFVADRFEFILSDYFLHGRLQRQKRIVRFLARSLKPSR